jgi:surfactin synthase thioesterase subunit
VNTRKQLYLLHFAGGSCCSFDFLKPVVGSGFEWHPLELPGRGRRYEEKLLRRKSETVADYVRQIKALRNDQPYLIFGHSMGAVLGLSVARQLEEAGDPPCHLVVSGSPGPGLGEVYGEAGNEKELYRLSDPDLKETLRRMGGIPEEVLVNEELFAFFSPIIRADFEVLQSDHYSERGLVTDCPIYALMGTEEHHPDKIENWARFTAAECRHEVLRGNHFFIYDHARHLANIIKKCSIPLPVAL